MAAWCRAARWVSNNYFPYDCVSAMLSNVSWRLLKYHHYIITPDSRWFTKIYHDIVAVPMPSYFEHRSRFTRNMHQRTLFLLTKLQVFLFSKESFLWNGLPTSIVGLDDLDSFKREVSKLNYSWP